MTENLGARKVVVDRSKKPTGEQIESLEKRRLHDREMVRGKFTYNEIPGAPMKFSYREYKGDPIEHFTLKDQGIYTIPRGVARHLAKNVSYNVYGNVQKSDGSGTEMVVKDKVNRCNFSSLDFLEI